MARTDMFLTLTGSQTGVIKGESSDKQFVDQIDVLSWNWGMTSPTAVGADGGGATGRVQMHAIEFVKRVDRASTALMIVMKSNELLTKVTLAVRKAGVKVVPGAPALKSAYFTVVLEKGRITSYRVDSGVDESGAPTLIEHLAITFRRITIEHSVQDTTGMLGGGTTMDHEIQYL